MIRLSSFAGKQVAVFGLGGSGRVAVEALVAGGAHVAAWDDSASAREAAVGAGVGVEDLAEADWSRFSSLVLAPGVPLTHPEPHWTVEKARQAGVEIIGDIELFARERKATVPQSPLIAITGTNGKSTTTALIAHLLRELGLEVEIGGNIGKAILSLALPAADRVHVIEMSSYQIDLTPTLDPSVGVLLNITPDHLERHGTMEHYAEVKARLVEGAARACISVDDPYTRAIADKIEPDDRLYAFTKGTGVAIVPRAYAIGSTLFVHEHKDGYGQSAEIANLDGIASLRGGHNVENALAAVTAIRALADQCRNTNPQLAARVWQPDVLKTGLATFPGLAHRLQQIGRLGRVVFVNDSKATNSDSTEKALASFSGAIFWIVGGQAKDGGIAALSPYFSRITKAYLIGEAGLEFAATLTGHVAMEHAETLDRAVALAAREAADSQAEQPVVLLSPACASFDQYRNFELRGEHFHCLVAGLPGVEMQEAGT